MSSLRVAIGQFNPTVGDFAQNRDHMIRFIEEARTQGARLVVFPELSVTGYPPRDLLDYDCFIDANLKTLEELAGATHGITAVCGFVERNPDPAGHPYYNSAAVLQDGKLLTVYRKRLLPYYDIFEETRYFEPGESSCIFQLDKWKIGVVVCEDAWNLPTYLNRPYRETPLKDFRDQGLDLLVNLSASPFSVGKPEKRISLFRDIAAFLQAPLVFCNQVAGNDELIFDGCSLALSAEGRILAAGKAFEEELVLADFASRASEVAPPWPHEESEWIRLALVLGIGDYVKKCGGNSVYLGLSGGIDSAVVAALAAEAVGGDNVHAISMPTRFNLSASQADAQALAKNLGARFRTVPIEPIFSVYETLAKDWFGGGVSTLTLENLQPRIRMTVLMAFANEGKGFLLNTSNKSEIATGYATLYGDTAGALAVLGDLTKNQVYALARHLNREREIIPQRIIDRPPSAELRENQTDQDSLPPYDVLDDMVVKLVEGLQPPSRMEGEFARKLGHLHAVSEYKRRQLPPVLRVSSRAFGIGRRMPVAAKPW